MLRPMPCNRHDSRRSLGHHFCASCSGGLPCDLCLSRPQLRLEVVDMRLVSDDDGACSVSLPRVLCRSRQFRLDD